MNSKSKGNISEAKALFEFQKFGIPVCLPWGDNERYDMIIELNKVFYRVQVKTANEESNGAIKCYCRSSANHTTNKKLSTYENEIDYFVFYNQTYDKIALVPFKETEGKKAINLRVSIPKNGQIKNIRFFDDYSFEKTLCVETLHGEPKE